MGSLQRQSNSEVGLKKTVQTVPEDKLSKFFRTTEKCPMNQNQPKVFDTSTWHLVNRLPISIHFEKNCTTLTVENLRKNIAIIM